MSGLLGSGGQPISIQESAARGRSGHAVFFRQTWTGFLSINRQPYRHTPVPEEIEALHVAASDARHAVRNCLMLSWAEEVGLRRLEILGILENDIPSLEKIDELAASKGFYRLRVRKAKGGKQRSVPVSWQLLRMTREYIELERRDLLTRYADRAQQVPAEVFLSDRGRPFSGVSISNLFNRVFFSAGVKNASLHRLRAAFLKRVVESFMDKVDERGIPIGEVTILLKAAEYAGHSSPESLRPYLNELNKARSEGSDAVDLANLRREKRLLMREIATLEIRSCKLRKS